MKKVIVKKLGNFYCEFIGLTDEEIAQKRLEHPFNEAGFSFEISTLTWLEKRQARYIELGCTESSYIMAMIQKECDNDNTLLDEYKAKRQQVKTEIPKV